MLGKLVERVDYLYGNKFLTFSILYNDKVQTSDYRLDFYEKPIGDFLDDLITSYEPSLENDSKLDLLLLRGLGINSKTLGIDRYTSLYVKKDGLLLTTSKLCIAEIYFKSIGRSNPLLDTPHQIFIPYTLLDIIFCRWLNRTDTQFSDIQLKTCAGVKVRYHSLRSGKDIFYLSEEGMNRLHWIYVMLYQLPEYLKSWTKKY